MSNGVPDARDCGMCGGTAYYMGSLGSSDYYRCRNCGYEGGYRARRSPAVRKRRSAVRKNPSTKKYYIHYPGSMHSLGPIDATSMSDARRKAAAMTDDGRLPRGTEVYEANRQNPFASGDSVHPHMEVGNKLSAEDQNYVLRAYVHRYTKDHIPGWVNVNKHKGHRYPVQFASDADWLRHTVFPTTAAGRVKKGRGVNCQSSPTWPDNPEMRKVTTVGSLKLGR